VEEKTEGISANSGLPGKWSSKAAVGGWVGNEWCALVKMPSSTAMTAPAQRSITTSKVMF